MKKLFSVMTFALLVVSVLPLVFAQATGSSPVGIVVTPESFDPLIWSCADRVVLDDTINPGRATTAGQQLVERSNNYAFEGEQIVWEVLVMDKNGIDDVTGVFGTVGSAQGIGNDVEVSCVQSTLPTTVPSSCNARILEENLTGTNTSTSTQAYYTCTLTVEEASTMFGEYYITVEAVSDSGNATIDENDFWFLNPTIALTITGSIDFGTVRPGSVSYSDTVLVENDAESGSGVLLDMFVSGTDFYDPVSSGARCPTTNRLKLGDQVLDSTNNGEATTPGTDVCSINLGSTEARDGLCYYATNGAYSTDYDPRSDAEGYVPIEYADQFKTDFYNDAEILAPTNHASGGLFTIGGVDYYAGNVLTPGSEVAMTFKVGIPEPCVGDFSDGDIFFWGEAI